MIAKRYRAVIFDFFGTLTCAIRRGPGHVRAARALGVDPVGFAALLDRTFSARARGEHGDTESTLRWLAALLGRTPSVAEIMNAARLRVDAIRSDIHLRPDAVPTLRRLHARGIRTALVSDCTEELPLIWPSLAVAALIETTVFSVQLGVTKPHPQMYATACRGLRVAPDDCLYLGDGGGRELSGAAHAGMTAVRLAAPDLSRHLVFDSEPEWHGATVANVVDVLALIDETDPHAPYWADERADRRLLHTGLA